jgi:hypothetical protein
VLEAHLAPAKYVEMMKLFLHRDDTDEQKAQDLADRLAAKAERKAKKAANTTKKAAEASTGPQPPSPDPGFMGDHEPLFQNLTPQEAVDITRRAMLADQRGRDLSLAWQQLEEAGDYIAAQAKIITELGGQQPLPNATVAWLIGMSDPDEPQRDPKPTATYRRPRPMFGPPRPAALSPILPPPILMLAAPPPPHRPPNSTDFDRWRIAIKAAKIGGKQQWNLTRLTAAVPQDNGQPGSAWHDHFTAFVELLRSMYPPIGPRHDHVGFDIMWWCREFSLVWRDKKVKKMQKTSADEALAPLLDG